MKTGFQLLLLMTAITSCSGQTPTYDLTNIDPEKPILFYPHGMIVENMGLDAYNENFGKYEYMRILATLEKKGFNVHSEIREKNTDIVKYAGKIVGKIEELIASGVDPTKITVVGASKGSMIAMMVSTKLNRNDVNFVLMAACNDYAKDNLDVYLCGRILSIYEKSDGVAAGCNEFFNNSPCELIKDEIALNTGLGHGFLFRPIKEWVDPAVKWAKFE